MSVLMRCDDESGCPAEVAIEDHRLIFGGHHDLAPGWQTWVPMSLGQETRHYCADHHHEWPPRPATPAQRGKVEA